jgi:hypothetical protein
VSRQVKVAMVRKRPMALLPKMPMGREGGFERGFTREGPDGKGEVIY